MAGESLEVMKLLGPKPMKESWIVDVWYHNWEKKAADAQ